ncbi:MAG: PorV/PorQ family protein [Ignavibacteria bacterium]|nr:PorV/PorQ family protein [Ignavibacteria bacterium]
MKLKLLLTMLFFTTLVFSQQEFKKNATAGFVFLELPVTARGAALGETSITLSDVNSAGVFTNIAATGFSELSHSFFASYSPWIADIKHMASSYTFNTAIGVFGIGFIGVDYGSMPKTKKIAGQRVYEVIGSFDANALAIGLTYSRKLTDRFSFGVGVKYVKEGIDIYTVDNFLFDGGILYYTGLGSLRIAATIQNFGVDAKYINDPFKMPALLRLGLAGEIIGSENSDYRVTALVEALHPNDADEKLNTGLEIAWLEIVSLRLGYKFFYDEESYSIGFGVNPQLALLLTLDFSYSDYGRLGKISRFSLQLGVN